MADAAVPTAGPISVPAALPTPPALPTLATQVLRSALPTDPADLLDRPPRVVLPVLAPLIGSVPSLPVQLGLTVFVQQYSTQWGQLMAATVVATLPVILVFAACQRLMVRGIAFTGLKG